MNYITKLYSCQQIREFERLAIANDINEENMMQRAGSAAFNILQKRWPKARKIAVIAGKGNNGGDGFIVAKMAHLAGIKATVYHVADLNSYQGAARLALAACKKSEVEFIPFAGEIDRDVDVIVDALLGIGIKGPVRANFAKVIHVINQMPCPVLALDVPSGLNADTGMVQGCSVIADATITFIGYKRGLFTANAPAVCGEIFCANLELPQSLYQQVAPAAELIQYRELAYLLPKRSRDANKGNFGHVLIVGGDHGMAGAVCLSATAALRCGAGLVSVVTRKEHVALVTGYHPEIMCHAVAKAQLSLAALIKKASVIVVGPGLGQSTWSKALLKAVIKSKKPLVIDADGLNLLAQKPVKLKNNAVITPHPGEAARLLAQTVAEIQHDRFESAKNLVQRYQVVAVLKGAGTIIQSQENLAQLCHHGNPGMATAGMGDVLSGIIGALIAQGLSLSHAATLGVCLHAQAADEVAIQGERGMIASDLFSVLRKNVNPQ